jgi:hypothetical protein
MVPTTSPRASFTAAAPGYDEAACLPRRPVSLRARDRRAPHDADPAGAA